MLLSPSFVLVKEITSNVPRSNFLEDDLNRAAELILKAEGTIKPLVVRSTGLDSYEVVDGHFEYYAAVQAKEINSREGERIAAFIIEGEKKNVLQEQVEFFAKQGIKKEKDRTIQPDSLSQSEISPQQAFSSGESKDINSLLQQLENSLREKIDILTSKVERLEERKTVGGLEDIVVKQLETITKVDNLRIQVKQIAEKTTTLGGGDDNIVKQLETILQESRKLPKEEALNSLIPTRDILNKQLEALNLEIQKRNRVNINIIKTAKDLEQLNIPQLGKATAEKIIRLRDRKGGRFQSLSDLSEVIKSTKNIAQWANYLVCE